MAVPKGIAEAIEGMSLENLKQVGYTEAKSFDIMKTRKLMQEEAVKCNPSEHIYANVIDDKTGETITLPVILIKDKQIYRHIRKCPHTKAELSHSWKVIGTFLFLKINFNDETLKFVFDLLDKDDRIWLQKLIEIERIILTDDINNKKPVCLTDIHIEKPLSELKRTHLDLDEEGYVKTSDKEHAGD